MELENIALNDPYFIEKNCTRTSISTWYHPESDGYSVFHVHRHFRNGTYRWLDRPLERNAQ